MTQEKRVGSLAEGTLFTVEALTARVLRSTSCRSLVQVAAGHKAKITTREGVDIEFDAPGAKISISPNTMVKVLEEVDDLLGLPIAPARAAGRGGKPAADKLIRPLNPTKKIGKVLQWLMTEPMICTIDDMSSNFQITRGCAMSYLSVLNKEYGIGYQVMNDKVMVTLPAGCEDPFKKG